MPAGQARRDELDTATPGAQKRPLPLSGGAEAHQEDFLKMVGDCTKFGVSPGEVIRSGLSRALGDTAAEAVLFYVGLDRLDDPRLFVERLKGIFHEGADALLVLLVAYEKELEEEIERRKGASGRPPAQRYP